jgi:hypothetical protein
MKSDKCLTHLIGTCKRNIDIKTRQKERNKKVGTNKAGLMSIQHVRLILHTSSDNYTTIQGKALPGKLTVASILARKFLAFVEP